MAIRIFLEVGYPKLKGILGAEMADVALQDFKNQPGISNIDSEGSQRFNYRTLTHAGKKGHPKSSAHARTLHAKRLGSRAAKLENRDGRGLSPHHSLAQGPAARRLSARNAARANHARELERIYNQHPYIPIGR